MKNKSLLIFAIIVFSCFNANSQVTVLSNGNVGLNNINPQYRLDVEGTVRISNWTDVYIDWTGTCCSSPVIYPETDWYLQLGKSNKRVGTAYISALHFNQAWSDSDEKLKENMDSVKNPLPKLMRVHGYSYNFKESSAGGMPQKIRSTYTKKQFGFVAQELEKEFPELVYKPDSLRPTYGVNYLGMVPILLEGLKNQQTQIEQLRKVILLQEQDIVELKKQLVDPKNSSKTKSAIVSDQDASKTITTNEVCLYQNAPNPFNQNTTISFFIPSNTIEAIIFLYDMQGSQIKSIPIHERGNGSVIIYGSELNPGMYIYTLIADGKEVGPKRMILTK